MNTDLVAAIRELINSSSTRKSKVGRIREILPDIELAQHAGVRLEDVSAALNQLGFEGMNLKCLHNLLYQARKNKSCIEKNPNSKIDARPVKPDRKGTSTGIDADSILRVASDSMKSKTASTIILDLLRSPKSTNERNTK